MRSLAYLIVLTGAVLAQPKPSLTPQDEIEIRKAIEEQSRNENLRGTGRVWSERGPLVYTVRATDALTADVATADADGARTGTYSEHTQYLFILKRTDGKWTIARKVRVAYGPAPVRLQPLSGAP